MLIYAMNIHETEAIVLNSRDYGESDRLITFYTSSGGKLHGLAKGAKRSQKRFVHTFESSSLVNLTYRERKSLIWIEACKLLNPHLLLREEIERWGYSAIVCEVVLEMVPEGESQEALFLLLKETMARLSDEKDYLNVMVLFLLRFLDIMGYLPALDGCRTCRRPLKSCHRWYWRTNQGVLTCCQCSSVGEDELLMDLGTMTLIQQCRSVPLDKVWRLRVRQDKKARLLHALLNWIRFHIRKDLKSLTLLRQLQAP